MKRLLQILAIAFVCSARGQGTLEGIANYSQSVVGSLDGTSGWTFSVANGIELTALGCFSYVISDQGPVSVGLWTSGGSLLASSLVTSGSALTNQTRYESITPIFLSPGQVYHLGIFSAGGSLLLQAYLPGSGGFVNPGPDVLVRGEANSSPGFQFPAELATDGSVIFGPNFLYRQVPEPTALAILGLGGIAWLISRRRQDQASNWRSTPSDRRGNVRKAFIA